MRGVRSRRGWVGGIAIVALLLMSASLACAAAVDPSKMRAVWVPRELSQGLVVDAEESRVPELYMREKEAPRGASSSPLLVAD